MPRTKTGPVGPRSRASRRSTYKARPVYAPPPPPVDIPVGTTQAGVLDLHPKGYGFLRSPTKNYANQPGDAYVSPALLDKYRLRAGLLLEGPLEPPTRGQAPRLADITQIEGEPAVPYKAAAFDDLTPINPREMIRLETGAQPLTTRVMDILTPIGKGQRGLIVAPPRTGKTVLLQHIAHGVAVNHPEMHLMVLLVDERPEEVTDMKRTIKGEVIASSSDRETSNHLRVAELVIERAKRMAERGRQVFVLLDSLTRLARAYNKSSNSGRTLSGGVDSKALDVPKRLFGTARLFEEGGSVTVIGTCLIETGSRMDDVIFQEFKGTGNMELVLERKLADRRVFPAIDIPASGTRKEEMLLSAEAHQRAIFLRRSLTALNPVAAMESLVLQLGKYPSNAAFLSKVATYMKAS